MADAFRRVNFDLRELDDGSVVCAVRLWGEDVSDEADRDLLEKTASSWSEALRMMRKDILPFLSGGADANPEE